MLCCAVLCMQGRSGARQSGLGQFFRTTARCLNCRQPLPHQTPSSPPPVPRSPATPAAARRGAAASPATPRAATAATAAASSASTETATVAPGLCEQCRREDGVWAATYVAALEGLGDQQRQLCGAVSKCTSCHSGGLYGALACQNDECDVLFARMGAARRMAAVDLKLRRLEASEPW